VGTLIRSPVKRTEKAALTIEAIDGLLPPVNKRGEGKKQENKAGKTNCLQIRVGKSKKEAKRGCYSSI